MALPWFMWYYLRALWSFEIWRVERYESRLRLLQRLEASFFNNERFFQSTNDRTLDQQCTGGWENFCWIFCPNICPPCKVSRPGLSLIASSYAVELMVSILQVINYRLFRLTKHRTRQSSLIKFDDFFILWSQLAILVTEIRDWQKILFHFSASCFETWNRNQKFQTLFRNKA